MEPFERMLQDATDKDFPDAGACMVILGRDSDCRDQLIDHLEERGHVCLATESVQDARNMIESHDAIDVLLVEGDLNDRDAFRLIRESQSIRSWVRSLVWSQNVDPRMTLESMREGASDCIVLPDGYERLDGRLDQMLNRVAAARDTDRRMSKLMDTCQKLSESRDEMSEQVDVLCGDLALAYRSMRDQMNDAVMVSEFKTLITQELDVEDMLRTALQYILQRLGPTNAVVYLPESSGRYGIGAYVNYDFTDRDPMPIYRALGQAVCQSLQFEDGLLRYEDAGTWAQSMGLECEVLHQSQIISFGCQFQGETLAILTFFRNEATPFDDATAGILDSLRGVLAEQLGRIVRIHRRGRYEWPAESDHHESAGPEDDQFPDWGDLAA